MRRAGLNREWNLPDNLIRKRADHLLSPFAEHDYSHMHCTCCVSESPLALTLCKWPIAQCMNTSVAFFGTEIGVADFGSGLNFLKTAGFLRKCCSRALTRFWSSGWSDKSCGNWLGLAVWKSWKSHTNPHGLYPV